MSDTCANISFQTMPDFCIEVPGEACLEVTVLDGTGNITLAQFMALMEQYNLALSLLPRFASEEDATTAGKVAGDEWLWADDTDVGIAGDKHIQRT